MEQERYNSYARNRKFIIPRRKRIKSLASLKTPVAFLAVWQGAPIKTPNLVADMLSTRRKLYKRSVDDLKMRISFNFRYFVEKQMKLSLPVSMWGSPTLLAMVSNVAMRELVFMAQKLLYRSRFKPQGPLAQKLQRIADNATKRSKAYSKVYYKLRLKTLPSLDTPILLNRVLTAPHYDVLMDLALEEVSKLSRRG